MKTIYAATLLFTSLTNAEVITIHIRPSATDPSIRTYDLPHDVYVNRDIVVDKKPGLPEDRHELVLWITGTHIKGTPYRNGAVAFCNLAADLGYHVVALTYPNDVAAAQFRKDSNPSTFGVFRMAIIQGGRTKYISIEPSESIQNRLIKLLQYLQENRPKDNWGQFLNRSGSIKWESIAVAGQSQGGGHAALIGIQYRTARVLCFGSPKDYNTALNEPAKWYHRPSATPKNRFFAFNHLQDPMGCTPEQLRENLKALELDAFGPPANVDHESMPYHHSRILFTGYPEVTVTGEESEGALAAHTSVISGKYSDGRKQVWTYMLTETQKP